MKPVERGEHRGQTLMHGGAVPQRRQRVTAAGVVVGLDLRVVEVSERDLFLQAALENGAAGRGTVGVGDDIEELGHRPIMTWIWTTRPGFAGDLAEELGAGTTFGDAVV